MEAMRCCIVLCLILGFSDASERIRRGSDFRSFGFGSGLQKSEDITEGVSGFVDKSREDQSIQEKAEVNIKLNKGNVGLLGIGGCGRGSSELVIISSKKDSDHLTSTGADLDLSTGGEGAIAIGIEGGSSGKDGVSSDVSSNIGALDPWMVILESSKGHGSGNIHPTNNGRAIVGAIDTSVGEAVGFETHNTSNGYVISIGASEDSSIGGDVENKGQGSNGHRTSGSGGIGGSGLGSSTGGIAGIFRSNKGRGSGSGHATNIGAPISGGIETSVGDVVGEPQGISGDHFESTLSSGIGNDINSSIEGKGPESNGRRASVGGDIGGDNKGSDSIEDIFGSSKDRESGQDMNIDGAIGGSISNEDVTSGIGSSISGSAGSFARGNSIGSHGTSIGGSLGSSIDIIGIISSGLISKGHGTSNDHASIGSTIDSDIRHVISGSISDKAYGINGHEASASDGIGSDSIGTGISDSVGSIHGSELSLGSGSSHGQTAISGKGHERSGYGASIDSAIGGGIISKSGINRDKSGGVIDTLSRSHGVNISSAIVGHIEGIAGDKSHRSSNFDTASIGGIIGSGIIGGRLDGDISRDVESENQGSNVEASIGDVYGGKIGGVVGSKHHVISFGIGTGDFGVGINRLNGKGHRCNVHGASVSGAIGGGIGGSINENVDVMEDGKSHDASNGRNIEGDIKSGISGGIGNGVSGVGENISGKSHGINDNYDTSIKGVIGIETRISSDTDVVNSSQSGGSISSGILGKDLGSNGLGSAVDGKVYGSHSDHRGISDRGIEDGIITGVSYSVDGAAGGKNQEEHNGLGTIIGGGTGSSISNSLSGSIRDAVDGIFYRSSNNNAGIIDGRVGSNIDGGIISYTIESTVGGKAHESQKHEAVIKGNIGSGIVRGVVGGKAHEISSVDNVSIGGTIGDGIRSGGIGHSIESGIGLNIGSTEGIKNQVNYIDGAIGIGYGGTIENDISGEGAVVSNVHGNITSHEANTDRTMINDVSGSAISRVIEDTVIDQAHEIYNTHDGSTGGSIGENIGDHGISISGDVRSVTVDKNHVSHNHHKTSLTTISIGSSKSGRVGSTVSSKGYGSSSSHGPIIGTNLVSGIRDSDIVVNTSSYKDPRVTDGGSIGTGIGSGISGDVRGVTVRKNPASYSHHGAGTISHISGSIDSRISGSAGGAIGGKSHVTERSTIGSGDINGVVGSKSNSVSNENGISGRIDRHRASIGDANNGNTFNSAFRSTTSGEGQESHQVLSSGGSIGTTIDNAKGTVGGNSHEINITSSISNSGGKTTMYAVASGISGGIISSSSVSAKGSIGGSSTRFGADIEGNFHKTVSTNWSSMRQTSNTRDTKSLGTVSNSVNAKGSISQSPTRFSADSVVHKSHKTISASSIVSGSSSGQVSSSGGGERYGTIRSSVNAKGSISGSSTKITADAEDTKSHHKIINTSGGYSSSVSKISNGQITNTRDDKSHANPSSSSSTTVNNDGKRESGTSYSADGSVSGTSGVSTVGSIVSNSGHVYNKVGRRRGSIRQHASSSVSGSSSESVSGIIHIRTENEEIKSNERVSGSVSYSVSASGSGDIHSTSAGGDKVHGTTGNSVSTTATSDSKIKSGSSTSSNGSARGTSEISKSGRSSSGYVQDSDDHASKWREANVINFISNQVIANGKQSESNSTTNGAKATINNENASSLASASSSPSINVNGNGRSSSTTVEKGHSTASSTLHSTINGRRRGSIRGSVSGYISAFNEANTGRATNIETENEEENSTNNGSYLKSASGFVSGSISASDSISEKESSRVGGGSSSGSRTGEHRGIIHGNVSSISSSIHSNIDSSSSIETKSESGNIAENYESASRSSIGKKTNRGNVKYSDTINRSRSTSGSRHRGSLGETSDSVSRSTKATLKAGVKSENNSGIIYSAISSTDTLKFSIGTRANDSGSVRAEAEVTGNGAPISIEGSSDDTIGLKVAAEVTARIDNRLIGVLACNKFSTNCEAKVGVETKSSNKLEGPQLNFESSTNSNVETEAKVDVSNILQAGGYTGGNIEIGAQLKTTNFTGSSIQSRAAAQIGAKSESGLKRGSNIGVEAKTGLEVTSDSVSQGSVVDGPAFAGSYIEVVTKAGLEVKSNSGSQGTVVGDAGFAGGSTKAKPEVGLYVKSDSESKGVVVGSASSASSSIRVIEGAKNTKKIESAEVDSANFTAGSIEAEAGARVRTKSDCTLEADVTRSAGGNLGANTNQNGYIGVKTEANAEAEVEEAGKNLVTQVGSTSSSMGATAEPELRTKDSGELKSNSVNLGSTDFNIGTETESQLKVEEKTEFGAKSGGMLGTGIEKFLGGKSDSNHIKTGSAGSGGLSDRAVSATKTSVIG